MHNKITAAIQNQIYTALFDLMGTTSTGYGARLISDPVAAGTKIEADAWNRLVEDVERCLIHQNGTSTTSLGVCSTGTEITMNEPAQIYTAIQFLQNDIGKVDPNHLASFTYNSTSTSPVSWTCTNYSSTATMVAGQGYVASVNWTWFYENQLNYFFNLGGTLQPEITIVSARPQELASWQNLVTAANNVVFGRNEFLQALSNPQKTYTFVITGHGDALAQRLNPPRFTTIIYQDTQVYSNSAITVTFKILGSTVIGTINFVAGTGKKGKKVFGKTTVITGKNIRVTVELETDFKTTYPTGYLGGIAAQIPQTQIIANSVSAVPSPIPQYVLGVGDVSTQTITLRNNSTLTCVVSDIQLSGYTTGTVYPTAFSIPANSTSTFNLEYTGAYPGHFNGLVDVLCNINRVTLFTEVNVGSTYPPSLYISTTTNSVISQDFVVDHAGGWFKDFAADLMPADGFTLTSPVVHTRDTFNLTFDPKGKTNGTHSTEVTVTVQAMDSSQTSTVWTVPIEINLNVVNAHLGDWTSCILGTDTILSISYDIFDGVYHITAGIGPSSATIVDLRTKETEFTTWEEVYRIPLTTPGKNYPAGHRVKPVDGFVYNDHFGVGNARGNMLTLDWDGLGNIGIAMNNIYYLPGVNTQETKDMSTAFRYYDTSRVHQLQNFSGLTQGGQTFVFNGFDKHGKTILSLVAPN